MILITAANGNIGSVTVKHLSQLGVPVRAMVHNRSKAGDLEGPNVEIVEGDFQEAASLDRAFEGVEAAFLITPPDPRSVELLGNMIEAAKRAGIQRLVRLSVIGAEPNSPVHLIRWHGQGEQMLQASGIPCTLLRPNSFMQNTLMLAPMVAAQGKLYQPAANAQISHIDARDIAAVAALALTKDGHSGQTSVLTGPQAITFHDVAAALSGELNREVEYIDTPPDAYKQSLMGFGAPEWLADQLLELYAYYREGKAAEVTDTVQQVTGKAPFTIAQFAHDYASAFQGR